MPLLHVNTYSRVLARNVAMNVILPEPETPKPWKTLYLLHGFSDDYSTWTRQTSIERYAEQCGIAVVMPSTDVKWYTDTFSGENYFTYISDELIKLTRRMFPCLSHDRRDTYVAGLSMGGYGAMKCGLSRPDIFSKAASLSGALDIQYIRAPERSLVEDTFWLDIFGPDTPANDDLFRLAEGLTENRPELFMWCGAEDFLYSANARMRDHFIALGYKLAYSESAGDHQWFYWDREIQRALRWMLGKEDDACR